MTTDTIDTPDEIDSTAVDETDPPTVSTALARRERRSEVIRPLSTDALVESFTAYQDMLPRLLGADDWQDAGRGTRFVKKSGWRKIAAAFDLDVQLIRSSVDRGPDGRPLRAEVWARAVAPSGRSMDGDGYCSADEDRFSGPRGNTSKLENDLRATATTRAKNRAISDLVGMGAVSAEEVDGGGGSSALPAWIQPASDDAKRAMVAALSDMLGHRATAVECAQRLAHATGGSMPGEVAAWVASLGEWGRAAQARAATELSSDVVPDGGADPAIEATLDLDDARAAATSAIGVES